MTRQTNKLSARIVTALCKQGKQGMHGDGGNLYLSIDKNGRCRWVFQYVLNHRQRVMGLGGCPAVALAEARTKAQESRKLLTQGVDPLETKRAPSEATSTRRTFGQCVAELYASKSGGWHSKKHRAQWLQSLRRLTPKNAAHRDFVPLRPGPIGERPLGRK